MTLYRREAALRRVSCFVKGSLQIISGGGVGGFGGISAGGGRAPVRTFGSVLAACGGKSAASPRPGAPADVGYRLSVRVICLSVSDRLSEKGVFR